MKNELLKTSIKDAKMGDVNAFMGICNVFYTDIFRLVYQLHPEYDHAILVTKQTFVAAWKNIPNYDRKKPIGEWISELAVLLSFYHLKTEKEYEKEAVPYEGHSEVNSISEYSDFDKIGKELPNNERFALIMYAKNKYSLQRIANLFGNIPVYQVVDYISAAFHKLVPYCDIKNIAHLSNDVFRILINSENEGDIYKSNFDDSTYEHFFLFREQVSNILSAVNIPIEKIPEIKIEVDSTEQNKRVVKNPTINDDLKKNEIQKRIEADLTTAVKDTIKITKYSAPAYYTAIKRILFSVVVLMLIYFGYKGLKDILSSNTEWAVSDFVGQFTIAGKKEAKEITLNQTLITGNNSKVTLKGKETGEIILFSNSVIRLLENKTQRSTFELKTGSLIYNSVNNMSSKTESEVPSLVIENDEIMIKIQTADIKLQYSSGERNIYVEKGWVEVKINKDKIFLADNYSFDLEGKSFIPFNTKTYLGINFTNDVSLFIEEYILNNLYLVKESDALTLWHLLPFLDRENRKIVVNILKEYYPLFIDEELEKGLNNLDSEAMEKMLSSIRWLTE